MARPALTGSRIRALRMARGLAQSDLARRVGVSPSYLNLIEHNRRRAGARLLEAIAGSLKVAPEALAEDAGEALVAALRAAATHASAEPPPETGRIDELIGRFPGWAAHLAALSARAEAQERVIERLSDRMAHDPNLSAALSEIVSAVTSVQSTAAILAETEELEPEWRRRFHRNVHADSVRLATAAEALVAFLDASSDESGLAAPLEELEQWLARHDFHLPEIEAEAPSDWARLVSAQPELASAASRQLAERWLMQAHTDAAALPLARLLPALRAQTRKPEGLRPEALAGEFGTALMVVLRRLACLPAEPGLPRFGLVRCDGSGTLTFRRPIEGFALPRFAGACPVWPLYQALAAPGRPLRTLLATPGPAVQHFLAHALAETAGPPRFAPPWVLEGAMLLSPATPPAQDGAAGLAAEPLEVGSSCRVCPRLDCPARREPSIVAG
ncbi:MAG: DUF2083 domain-containing protein [Pararhodobacter sp.]|nr:DUF2083 domain-containing protein [Pararhodobacter sp.]